MARDNKSKDGNSKPTPKPVDSAVSMIMSLYSALFLLTLVVATLGVFFMYSFRGLFDDMTLYYIAIYFFASAALLLLSSLASIFTMQAVRLGHRLHMATNRTLQVCLGLLFIHLMYDVLLLLYFGVLAMQLRDVEATSDDVNGNGSPLSIHEKVIGGLFNEVFFNLVVYCEEGPAWLWQWIDTQCDQGLHTSACDQCEPAPGFCGADAVSCINGNDDVLSQGCPYPLCRESVLRVVGTYVCVFMVIFNLVVAILHLICMVCVCSQGKYVGSAATHKVAPQQLHLTPSAPDPPSVESILVQPFTQEGQVF